MIRKILSLVLILVMLTSVFCISTSAMTVYVEDFGFEFNTSTMEATIVEYTGDDVNVAIPIKVYDYSVTKLGDSLFKGNKTIESVTISSTIKTLGNDVFLNCSSLKTATIPSTVESVGKSTFQNCTSLEKVEFLADILSLPQATFRNCKALKDVTLSVAITEVENLAFYNCESLTTVPNCDYWNSIGQSAFYNTGITEFKSTGYLMSIGYYAFGNCKNLEKVEITPNVESIETSAFQDSPNVRIYCYTDSYAHNFAKDNNIAFFLLDGVNEIGILGDVGGDDVVSVMDATHIQEAVAKIVFLSEYETLRADVDADLEISIMDATAIQKHIAKLPTGLPIGTPVFA